MCQEIIIKLVFLTLLILNLVIYAFTILCSVPDALQALKIIKGPRNRTFGTFKTTPLHHNGIQHVYPHLSLPVGC